MADHQAHALMQQQVQRLKGCTIRSACPASQKPPFLHPRKQDLAELEAAVPEGAVQGDRYAGLQHATYHGSGAAH